MSSHHHQTFVHEPLGEKEGSNRRNNSSRRSSADDKDVAYSSLPYVKSRAGEERREMEGFQKSSNPFPAAPLSASSISLLEFPHGEGGKLFLLFARNETLSNPALVPLSVRRRRRSSREEKLFHWRGGIFSITCVCCERRGGWVGGKMGTCRLW